jgi:hypothetical protein
MAVVLDAGPLIAAERQDREVLGLLLEAKRKRAPLRTSAAVVAQVWRDGARQAALARLLDGVEVIGFDEDTAHHVGSLLGAAGHSDVVDGHVAFITGHNDVVLTSDAVDIRRLLVARGVAATVEAV